MSKEGFFSAVHQTYRSALPAVVSANDRLEASAVETALRGADLWLTPEVVEGYDPKDFCGLPPTIQESLAKAVEGFRRVAAAVSPAAPATQSQRDEAWEYFSQILQAVRTQVLAEWSGAVDALFQQVEGLGIKQDWGTKRFTKTLTDSFLGTYELPQLLVHRPDARFILDPVARFAPGTTGLIDLYVMPSLGGAMLTRVGGNWRIHSPQHGQPAQPWSEGAFLATLDGLSRAAA